MQGTKDDLVVLCKKAKELGIGLYWDAVLNHKVTLPGPYPSRDWLLIENRNCRQGQTRPKSALLLKSIQMIAQKTSVSRMRSKPGWVSTFLEEEINTAA